MSGMTPLERHVLLLSADQLTQHRTQLLDLERTLAEVYRYCQTLEDRITGLEQRGRPLLGDDL